MTRFVLDAEYGDIIEIHICPPSMKYSSALAPPAIDSTTSSVPIPTESGEQTSETPPSVMSGAPHDPRMSLSLEHMKPQNGRGNP